MSEQDVLDLVARDARLILGCTADGDRLALLLARLTPKQRDALEATFHAGARVAVGMLIDRGLLDADRLVEAYQAAQ